MNMSVEFIAIIVVGGATTVLGAVLGALFYSIALPLAESAAHRVELLDALSSSQHSLLVLAVLVIAFMLIEPTGLRGLWVKVRQDFANWPFRY